MQGWGWGGAWQEAVPRGKNISPLRLVKMKGVGGRKKEGAIRQVSFDSHFAGQGERKNFTSS